MKINKKLAAVLAGIAVVASVAACDASPTSTNTKEQQQQANIQNSILAKQPLPNFDYSQYRQTLITVESAEAHGVATTSFFFNLGVRDPYFVCPSIGFPVPSTANLSNPLQAVWGGGGNGGYAGVTVGQMDPTGVYTGDSQGTYVECVAPGGTQYAKYAEPNVDTIGGPAHWDANTHQEVLDGAPTVVTKK